MDNDKNNDKQNSVLSVMRDVVGSDEFKSSRIGYLTGASALRKSFVGSVSQLGQSSKIFGLARRILLPARAPASELARFEDDRERFAQAAARFDTSEASLQSLQRGTFWSLWLYFGLAVLSVIWGAYLLASYDDISGFLDVLFPFFPLFAIVPLFLKQSLWHHQLRTRSLTHFSVFIKHPEWWFPLAPSVAKTAMLMLALGTLVAGLSPYAAVAGGFNVTDTLGQEDLFYRMLQMLAPIGPVGMPVDVSPWVLPLADAFAAFNTTLLVVGALMLGWHTIAGTVASAYEGEVLGQRWHTIWAPLRVTVGIGSLAPVANGFCAAQILVIQLVVWGGGIANEVWSGYVGYFSNADRLQSMMLPDTDDPSVIQASLADLQNNSAARNMILGTLEKQVCLLSIREIYTQAYNNYALTNNLPRKSPQFFQEEDIEHINDQFRSWVRPFEADRIGAEENGGSTGLLAIQRGVVLATVVDGETTVRTSNQPTAITGDGLSGVEVQTSLPQTVPKAVWDYGEYCGTITMDLSGAEIVQNYLTTVAEGEGLDKQALDAQLRQNSALLVALNKVSHRIKDGYDERNILGFNQIAMDLSKVAETILASDRSEDALRSRPWLEPGGLAEQALAKAYADYRKLMNAITTDYLLLVSDWVNGVDVNDFVGAMSAKGWSAAGSFYVTLAKMQQLKWSMPIFLPEISEIDHGYLADEHDEFRAILEGGPNHTGVLNIYANFVDSALKNDSDEVIQEYTSSGDDDGWALIDYFSNIVADIVFNQLDIDPFNAMLDLVEMGTTIIYVVFIIGGVVFAISFAGGLASATGIGAAGKLANLSGMSENLIGALTGPAASLAFLFKMVLMLVLAVGIVHAFVLPMIPYVLFLFFVMGMLILTAEALVAAPLWALFHVRLDGQDFVDQVQRPGYMIAFNLLLRPTLAVFGLILSYVVFGAMIWFINETFEIAGKSVIMAAGGMKLLGLLVMLVLLTYLHYQVAIRSFTLITSLPDRVTRWFGQSSENLGEEGDSDKSTNFIVGNVSNRIESMAKAGGMGSGRGSAARGAEDEAGKDVGAAKSDRTGAKRGAQRTSGFQRPDD